MKKSVKVVLTVIAVVFMLVDLLGITVAIVYDTELKTIKNIKKLDDYGFFMMNYTRDYGLSEFLASGGASSEQELVDYIISDFSKGLPIKINVSDYGCSAFNAVTPEGDKIFGRNFDWIYSPSMLVWSDPPDGYASMSMINLGFLAYEEGYLPDSYFNRFTTLAAPYVPLDGMNEKGLAIGVLMLDNPATNQNTDKTDLTTTSMIRLILDRAATVQEAIELFQSYDMHDSVGYCYHYLITDASGSAAVLEYVDNEMIVTYPEHSGSNVADYIAVTNFYLSEEGDNTNSFGQDRHAIISGALSTQRGELTEEEAMNLLSSARYLYPDEPDRTEWSAVYNLTDLTVSICVGTQYDKVYRFSLDKPMEYAIG
jgi:hypothetical protein